MSFLNDKEWDQMDWLNKAVEPFKFSLNEELAKLPSEHVFSYGEVIGYLVNSREMRVESILNVLAPSWGLKEETISMMGSIGIDRLFKLELEAGTTIDLHREVLIGKVSLVKIVESLSDDAISELLPQIATNVLRLAGTRITSARMNEAMDILDCKEARSSSSVRKKSYALMDHIFKIYRDNTWNIRNVDLAIKMLGWIQGYLHNGDRCSLANLSKLKCMIHNGHPIYSMEEIK